MGEHLNQHNVIFNNSMDLLMAAWNMQAKDVAAYIEKSHYETSILQYNDENDKPAMLVELKYDKKADAGICQIKEKKYYLGLDNYLNNLLLVGVNYDPKTKKTCMCNREI